MSCVLRSMIWFAMCLVPCALLVASGLIHRAPSLGLEIQPVESKSRDGHFAADLTSGRREILFADPSIAGYEHLIAGLDPSVEVVLIESHRDGLEQIAATLRKRQSIDAIHLIAHGAPATLQLATAHLTLDSMVTVYADALLAIRQALTPEADFVIYGCNFGAGSLGQVAVTTLSVLTDADIAASDDLTGAAVLGGDWDLEVQTGTIETAVIVSEQAQKAFTGVLDVTTGLQGHWTFNTNAADASGNAYNGTLTNGAAIDTADTTDMIGAGKVSLDGVNDYVDIAAHVANFSGLSRGTISAWVRTTGGTQSIFSASDTTDSNSDVTFRLDSSGHLEFDVFNNNTALLEVESIVTLNDNAWHHVAVTVNTAGNMLYIDGLATSVTYLTGNATTNRFFDDVSNLDSMSIGRAEDNGGGKWYFSGLLDDVRVYDRALSPTDMSELAAEAPVATNDAAITYINSAVNIDVIANDTDLDNETISVLDVTHPSNGAVVNHGDGTVTYTPDTDYTGSDQLTYVTADFDDTISYWRLDGNGVDAVASNDGAVTGTNTVAGYYGDALSFDEVDDHVIVPDFAINPEFSLSFRFKVDDNAGSLFQYIYIAMEISTQLTA